MTANSVRLYLRTSKRKAKNDTDGAQVRRMEMFLWEKNLF